ncbi:MAG TPA: efflux RND transporter permease subunit [Cyclobacteriaceae bacterium]|nr:efflux RND transporter permease subunit [Cyclobacteriaceae bacterium]
MKITKIAITRSTIIVVIFAALTFGGIFSYNNLTYELLPNFSIPVITVSTSYPGAGPSEVENAVTKKIEGAISALENIKDINSTSQEGYSLVTVQLNPGTDINLALQDAQRKVNAIISSLPEDVQTPSLGKFDVNDMPIMQIGATSNIKSTDFYDLLKQRVEPAISQIKGVAQVSLQGGEEREIRINVDAEKLKAYNLSILQVNQAVSNANQDFPTGKIKDDSQQILIRLAGKFMGLDEIRELVIIDNEGSPIRMKDIAEVQDTQKEKQIISRVNGVNSIGIVIKKQSDGNAVEISKSVKEVIARLEEANSDKNLKFVIANDTSDFTLEAADAVIHDLVLAIALVAAVMLLFLHSLRNAIIVMIAIPASLISTFIVMSLLGFSLNLMTLLALSLVVGILVDDAIVVLENIYRHMEMGKSKAQASLDAIKEIGFTVISITAVIVVVFLPIAMVQGLISDLLRQFSIVVAVATALSLFVAFTLIPLLSSRFSKLEHLSNKNILGRFILGFEKVVDKFTEGIQSTLSWSFRHKTVTLVGVLILFIGSVSLVGFGFIGTEFVSGGDQGEFNITLELPKNASVEETNKLTQKVESYLRTVPAVTSITTTVGASSGSQGGQSTAYKSEIAVKLTSVKERDVSTEIFANRVRNEIEKQTPGVKVRATPVSMGGGGGESPIQIGVEGPDMESIMSFAEIVKEQIRSINGIADTKLSVEGGNPEINVKVDRDKMATLGLSIDNVGANLQTAFNGTSNQGVKYRDGDFEYDINVILDAFDRKNRDDIANLTFLNNKGELITLNQFATVEQSSGPSVLERTNRISSVTVQAGVVGRPSGTVGAEIQEKMKEVDIPAGISISYKGDMENQADAFGSLGFALLTSILLVYLIMVALYDSYVYPFVVLFSIPLAIIGALLALALAKQTMNIFSILGIIMLIGLVAKNAILVVDFTNDLKKAGKSTKDALMEATRIRLRPILMTTLAMVIGMMPIAIATGAGSEWKNGLAWSLIGGLTSSMFLTLIVVPIIYYLIDRVLAKLGLDKKEEIKLIDKSTQEIEAEMIAA